MSIKLKCACGKALSIKDELAGRRVKCPGCQTLLRVPKPKVEEASFGDEWDLGDATEQEFDDEPRQTQAKSRGGRSLPTRGSNSRQTSAKGKGKKPQPSKRGLLIGLSAGGGVLVIALVAWMLWPEGEGSNVAVAPNQNAAGSPVTTSGDSTSSTNTASVEPSTPPNVVPANPDAPATNTTATMLEGDLKFLQGTWQVTDLKMPPDAPGAAEAAAQMNLITFTIKDDMLTIATPGGAAISSIKLDSTVEPRAIDLIPLDGGGRKTSLGIYSIEGETWQMCSNQDGTARPMEMKAALGQVVATFKRSSVSPAAPASSFDIKAWLAAESKLKAMKVTARLEKWGNVAGVTGQIHVVTLSLPETSDGTMSLELWAIVSSISHIAVRTSFVTDATLRQLAQHPGLLGIVNDTRSTVTADGIGALKACPQLGTFMFYAPISPELCEAISQLAHLRTFGISNSPVSKEMLNSIVRLSQLESLVLTNTGITDDGALQIQALAKLKYLTLSQTNVTDQSLKTLSSLQDLESLILDQTKVTDEGLETLKSLTKLKVLGLQQTKVTDEGLKILASFRGLNQLWIGGLNVTPQGIAGLEKELPKCHVMK